MIFSGKLNTHLNEVDLQARDRVEILVKQMAEKQGITEQLKSKQPMVWVQKMNELKNVAEEIILQNIFGDSGI